MEPNKTAQGLSIGPVLQNFLFALRALATAREYTREAYEGLLGEDDAAKLWGLKHCKPFDALADSVEAEIMDAVREWAYKPTPTNEI